MAPLNPIISSPCPYLSFRYRVTFEYSTCYVFNSETELTFHLNVYTFVEDFNLRRKSQSELLLDWACSYTRGIENENYFQAVNCSDLLSRRTSHSPNP